MGTVLEFHGVKVRVLGNDHNPPHCHAVRGACEARYDFLNKSWLSCEGFTRSDLKKIEVQILARVPELWDEWSKQNEK